MTIPTLWRRRTWRARALRWAEHRLADHDIHLTGKPDQFHVRTWSTVIRLPTDRGAYFFKAVWRPLRFEAGLTAAIATWAPNDVGIPLATDARRGWMILEDGGQRLREILAKDRDVRHWHRILPQYAELQIAMGSHVRQALKLGAPDRRATALVAQYADLLERPSLLRVGLKEGLTATQETSLRDLVPQVRAWLEALGVVPDTIQHDDLHDGQVREGRSVPHPRLGRLVRLASLPVDERRREKRRVYVEAEARIERDHAAARHLPRAVHGFREQGEAASGLPDRYPPWVGFSCDLVGDADPVLVTSREKKRARRRAALSRTVSGPDALAAARSLRPCRVNESRDLVGEIVRELRRLVGGDRAGGLRGGDLGLRVGGQRGDKAVA